MAVVITILKREILVQFINRRLVILVHINVYDVAIFFLIVFS